MTVHAVVINWIRKQFAMDQSERVWRKSYDSLRDFIEAAAREEARYPGAFCPAWEKDPCFCNDQVPTFCLEMEELLCRSSQTSERDRHT